MPEVSPGPAANGQERPAVRAVLDAIRAMVPALTAIAGGLWVAFTYLDQQRVAQDQQARQAERDDKTRLFDSRKPFYDKQLLLYFETAQTIGKLVSTDPRSAAWDQSFERYEQLYWAELSMVEDDGVKGAMQDFATALREIADWKKEGKPVARGALEDLRQRSYRLARALRASIERTWTIDLSR